MGVLLVNPACLDNRLSGEDSGAVPMGLFFIGALLIESKIRVRLLNLAAESSPAESLTRALAEETPAVVGISVLNANRFSAMETARQVKQSNPSALVVFGGPGATFLAGHLFAACSGLDVVVLGEGEKTFLELVQRVLSGIAKLDEVPGLIFRDGDSLRKTADRPLIQNLDSLPQPGRYFDLDHVSLSRGCPGRCRFCGSPEFWGSGRVRFHSAEWFVDHLEILARRGITHFFVSDDTFTMDRERVLAVCRKILARRLAITWVAISRADFVDETVLGTMRQAGCTQISFGVESGSADIRRRLGKPMQRATIVRAFHLCRSYGILPRIYLIYGSPSETEATVDESIELIMDAMPLAAIFYILVVFPGTGLYRQCRREGRVDDRVWSEAIEDIAWFEMDPDLDFSRVKNFGDRLRKAFFANLSRFARSLELVDDPTFYPLHADFLSRLAMTFSHGDFSCRPDVEDPDGTAVDLYQRALGYAPDARAFLGLAMLHQKTRNFNAAVTLLDKGLAVHPGVKNLNLCMAVSLMNLGRFDRALTYLSAFEDDPDVQPYVAACRKSGGIE